MSKIFTFESIFELTRIDRSVLDKRILYTVYIRYYTVYIRYIIYGIKKSKKLIKIRKFIPKIYTENIYRYYIRYIFPNFRILISFFDFLIDSQPLPFFRLVILLDIYRAYKISTISDVRHDEAYF